MSTQQEQFKIREIEAEKRNQLKKEKPYVYEKIMRYDEKIKRGESIAILQFQYDYTCNFTCEHCSIDRFQHKTKKERVADTRRFFTPNDAKELSRQADEMGLAHLVVSHLRQSRRLQELWSPSEGAENIKHRFHQALQTIMFSLCT